MRRLQVFLNRNRCDGKVFALNGSLHELLEKASEYFSVSVTALYTEAGAIIDEVELIRDDDVLFISKYGSQGESGATNLNRENEWISLNVGGTIFKTTKNTLLAFEPNSMLAKMFESSDRWLHARDSSGAILLDRSPVYFEIILNYLRHGQLILDHNISASGVLEEAKFFGMESLISRLETIVKNSGFKTDHCPLTRREVIRALLTSQSNCELRFQGMNFAGADLSRLDLRYINFKLANLKGCNLTKANLYCCSFERADVSYTIMDGANLQGVKMLCSNAEGSSMRRCNFDDPSGLKANMEGANMKGVNFEGSLMAGANLRVATLKNSNLKNCNLRGAVLAGTDLENCDLSGCDLFEANLRGCNVDGTKFEEMITPLHMTQTVPP